MRVLLGAVLLVAVLAVPGSVGAAGPPPPASAALAASDHTCAITTVGGVACWGGNEAGGLGDGTATSRVTPVAVVGLRDGVVAVAAGDRASCALTFVGGVKCWGYNEFGQLGDGSATNRLEPVDVVGLSGGVTAIAARGEHACALTAAGGVKCWGADMNGQLGDGARANSPVPVDVVGLSRGVATVATGGEHTCALTTSGGVKCWGWGAAGQLGSGTTADISTPSDVLGLASGVTAIATGGRHTCALLAAGAVKCWGYDKFGQLGDGGATDSAVPVDVVGLPGEVVAITAGGNFTCAVGTAGGVSCWGIDLTGQRAADADRGPVGMTGLQHGVTAIVAGFYHACAIETGGTVACWGGNETGQLGNGTTSDSANLTPVTAADGTILIAAHRDVAEPASPVLIASAIAAMAVVGAALLLALRSWRRGRRPAPSGGS